MLFPKWCESTFNSRLKIKYIEPIKIDQLVNNGEWQIVILKYRIDSEKNYFPLSTIIDPLNYRNESILKLNKNKKILVYGPPYKNVYYYRFLKNEGYNVYLSKFKLVHFIYTQKSID